MEPLRYHDFHLRGYAVSDFGTRIVLDLVYRGVLFLDGLKDYLNALRNEYMRAWRIASALGFDGFVIAKSISGEFTAHPACVGGPTSTHGAA